MSVRPTRSHLLLLVSVETSLPQLPLPPARWQSGSTMWETGVAFSSWFLWPNMTFLGCFSRSLPFIDGKTSQKDLSATVEKNEASLLKTGLGLTSRSPGAFLVSDPRGRS